MRAIFDRRDRAVTQWPMAATRAPGPRPEAAQDQQRLVPDIETSADRALEAALTTLEPAAAGTL